MSLKTEDCEIGNPEEAFWTEVKEAADNAIEQSEKSLKVNRAISEMAALKIEKNAL